MKKPLEGLFVVEMTSYWAATTTARFLRAMGARVVKIETPPIGDACRYYGRSMGMPITAEENPVHDIFNGGKECIALDLKKKENLQIVYNMLEKADMFVTSTRTSGLKKLGLDWETLHEKYPKLVMGQVTGYGNKGPLVSRPGIDAIAYFGANGVVLDTRTDPNSPPIYPTGGMGDQKETRENIANGVHNGIGNRICSMFRSLGIRDGVAFIGGPSLNKGLVASLSKELGQQVIVPDLSVFLSAAGAALAASEAVERNA